MEKIELFAVRKEDLNLVASTHSFGEDQTFCFGDGRVARSQGDLYQPIIYCHTKWRDEGILNQIFVSGDVDWYFNNARIYDWVEFNRSGKRVLFNAFKNHEREDDTMFENYTITEVKFGEVNMVALKTSMKQIVKELEGVELVKEGTETYLVKDGTAVKIDGAEFQSQVTKYVVGKTMAELKKNAAMYKIITKLGLISACTLQKQDDGLAGIFG